MLFQDMLDINIVQNHGVLVEQLLVFPEFLEVEHQEQDKELLVTCVEEVECLHQQEHGENGTEKLILVQEDLPVLQQLQHLQFQH